ncbi:MAG: LysR family transcriptional regulator [Anaerovibrio sp.]|uniref:LysR family transcriptional regulator n=1 Tax=Anaerovibrio sp. TaxID=1872532 RepID=UPI0025E6502F|nr:LysR family transcriptional regulator [Anaerovibrio sp.]MCR5176783.1 LysR family transcriptional regulator [Anaerovibrio sp.]
MEFRHLEYFCAISRLQNFTKTAEYLHVSQPSVTKAIKALESELQLALIDRRQKHVTLTTEGKAFLLHAEKIMNNLENAMQDMERFRQEKYGTIHFGIPPMVEAYLFPDLFTTFKDMYPDMSLDVKEYSDSGVVMEKADNGELDFGIIFTDKLGDTDHEMLIQKDNLSLCVSPELPLAKKSSIDFDDLRNEQFIMQQSNTYQYQHVYERCVERGYVPDILLCTTQLKTIKQLVANRLGISVLPDFVTMEETKFVRRQLTPPLSVDICLYWGKDKELTKRDTRFLNFMKHYIASEEFKRNFQPVTSDKAEN